MVFILRQGPGSQHCQVSTIYMLLTIFMISVDFHSCWISSLVLCQLAAILSPMKHIFIIKNATFGSLISNCPIYVSIKISPHQNKKSHHGDNATLHPSYIQNGMIFLYKTWPRILSQCRYYLTCTGISMILLILWALHPWYSINTTL